MRTALFVGFALAWLACAPAQPAEHPLIRLAPFDLGCPMEQLQWYKLDEKTWGVRGCGRQVRYMEICQTSPSTECRWVAN